MLILDENLLTYKSKLTFGWLNMVGEIGGTVGLCLGWSLMSFLEMTNLFGHNIGADLSILKKINASLLILVFLYWSYGLFDDYHRETESMELVLETDSYLDTYR